MVVVIGLLMAARSYHHARSPDERIAASVAIASVLT
jgi:hypothetical protein